MTQIIGAGIAGIVYKILNYGDFITAAIAFTGFGIVYVIYRRSIAEVSEEIDKAEEAERQKAESEILRRKEAEKHGEELTVSLKKEKQTSEALIKSEKNLQKAVIYDSLTGLANRRHFVELLRNMINEYRQNSAKTFHVLFLDISHFKTINDSLGHTIGDKVLRLAARRFVRMIKSEDIIARIGGDEFAVILKNIPNAAKSQKVAKRIQNVIMQPFSLSGNRISISVDIGIAPCDAEYTTPEEILRDADIAMHFAKEKDMGVAIFTKDLRTRFMERARVEMELRNALEREEFSMHYQPIVSLADGELFGFEALLRWQHGEFGFVPPSKFIPVAENSGLIIPMTNWILNETCRRLRQWQKLSPAYKNLIVSVNISGKHLATDDLIEDVENALETAELEPQFLKLEITESSAMENAQHTANVLRRLKHIGVQLSIDDFGTGYSSLSYLHSLPFDTLKIDRSFVSKTGENGENFGILQTIVSLAKNLRMRAIAEGIETEAQLALLRQLGCDYGQGYLFAKPKPAREIEEFLFHGARVYPYSLARDFTPVQPLFHEESLPVF